MFGKCLSCSDFHSIYKRNNDLKFIVIIIDIDWHGKILLQFLFYFFIHIAQPYSHTSYKTTIFTLIHLMNVSFSKLILSLYKMNLCPALGYTSSFAVFGSWVLLKYFINATFVFWMCHRPGKIYTQTRV